jgi:hypothetical protein
VTPRSWPDAERKKALVEKRLRREGDVALFLFQWIESLERRIQNLERAAAADRILVKPKRNG